MWRNRFSKSFVKQRNSIGESGGLISHVIEINDWFHFEWFLVTIDIEKAFDSLDHDFLSFVWRKFEFGKIFVP